MKRLSIVILSLAAICCAYSSLYAGWPGGAEAFASTIELPQTGQTTCYNADGDLINCAGTGQDGDIQAGKTRPSIRFTDNSIADPDDWTLTDHLTGLIWTKDGNLMKTRDPGYDQDKGTPQDANDGVVTWQHALDYLKKLNEENYLGHSDWRLPNRNEFASLHDINHTDDAKDWLTAQGFVNIGRHVEGKIGGFYWSSSTFADATNKAWEGSCFGQIAYSENKTNFNYYTWPVRGGQSETLILPGTGQTRCYDETGAERECDGTGEDGETRTGAAWPNPRFSDNSIDDPADRTMTDNLTGLIWRKDGNPAELKNWQQALDYIKTLNNANHLGHGDWRLPNREELVSLSNCGEADSISWLNGQGFVIAPSDEYGYWTSTTYDGSPEEAWVVGLRNGTVGSLPKKGYSLNVWPVCGGQVISVSPDGKEFGSIPTGGASESQTFTIGNSGTADLVISGITLADGDTGMFTLDAGDGTDGTCGTAPVIRTDCNCTVSVVFAPASPGEKRTSLRIVSNDSVNPIVDVALSGTAENYTISTSVVGNGAIYCDSSAPAGSDVICTIIPAPGHHLAAFTDNLADSLSSVFCNQYTISNVSAHHDLVATFAVSPYRPYIPAATGQTACHDASGAAIPCSGTGQDGDTLKGTAWPSPRFIDNSLSDSADQTVTDQLTGLVWTKDGNPLSNPGRWQEALASVANLNAANYLGHNDWRLPNINELKSLVNAGEPRLADWLNGQSFTNIKTDYYWSSTTHGGYTGDAWVLFLVESDVQPYSKGNSGFVWPVRDACGTGGDVLPATGQSTSYADGDDGALRKGVVWPNPRFTENNDQTVTDHLTGLVWTKDGNPADVYKDGSPTIGMKTWQQALDYVASLNQTNYLNHNDWRLPNLNELGSMVNRDQSNGASWWLNTPGWFINVQPQRYWTSSTYAFNEMNAWAIGMHDGAASGFYKANTFYVWPVRGVQMLVKGDVKGDGSVDLADAVLAMKVVAGLNPAGIRANYPASGADVSGNGKMGMEELIYIIQQVAGIR